MERVSKTYPEDHHKINAVIETSAVFRRGQLSLILGPSGSGKTTLLMLIAGFVKPTSGTIRVNGTDLASVDRKSVQAFRAEKIGFIFQNFLLLDWLTVVENVALPSEFLGESGISTKWNARAALEKVGAGHLAGRYPTNLSQGEKQRVAIARASVNTPSLLLADEPTASLDSAQGFGIIKILHSIAKTDNRCVIVASHDLRLTEYADVVFRLEDGRLRAIDVDRSAKTFTDRLQIGDTEVVDRNQIEA